MVTPVEIVDFQIRALADVLKRRGMSFADQRVQVTDPFGGTGIYLARLMQISGLTPDELDDLYHNRMTMIEIDKTACQMADANLRQVFYEETGRRPLPCMRIGVKNEPQPATSRVFKMSKFEAIRSPRLM